MGSVRRAAPGLGVAQSKGIMRPIPPSRRALSAVAILLTASALTAGLLAAPAEAATDPATRLAERLVRRTNVADANRHLIAFQRIADRNGGNRSAPTAENPDSPGYDASVDYVVGKLRDAGFRVTTPSFSYPVEVEDAASLTVGAEQYRINKMNASIDTPEGGVTGPLVAVPADADTGCQAADFAGQNFNGAVALIRRGGCTFELKALNAAAAGAVVAVIYNNVAGPLTNVTITNPGPIPVGGISDTDGAALLSRVGQSATVDMRYHEEERTSVNVIAETRTGSRRNVVMSGAHLDSIDDGPGMNDNGGGAAAQLDAALKLGGSPKISNRVRFAWWGAEELGLLGAEAYVAGLTFEQQLDIALYLNFDMVGSTNAGYFVYDGDNSDAAGAPAGPFGSAQIERTFTDFFIDRLDVPTEGTDFDGRSDYGPFIAAGIPAGGLFTGAEGIKTEAQAAKWGGTAGVAYDPCYHQACDNLGNVDRTVLDRNLDAMAWAIGIYAYSTEEINGVPPRSLRALQRDKKQQRVRVPDVIPGDKAA